MIDLTKFKFYLMGEIEKLAERSQERLRESISILYPPASEPNNPPHLRTGDLQAGCTVTPDFENNRMGVDIKSSIEYSEFLEFGTTQMAPRPFIRPEAERVKEDLTEIIENLTITL